MKKLLVIGKNWPEPKTTAAGYRMLQLLEVFKESDYKIIFCSAAQKSDYSTDLESIGIEEKTIYLNDHSFDTYVNELQPDMVMFDRFMTEEQYGWRIRDNSPKTIHILDTEDLHFLRKARQVAFKEKGAINVYNETAMREIAAIYRCDLSLIISEVEMDVLKDYFDIPYSKLIYIPFLYHPKNNRLDQEESYKYKERSNFIMIGNSKHEPNYDAILHLKKNIWPLIKKQIPTAQVHIYGAYQTDKILQLQNIKEGFVVKGFAQDAHQTLSKYKILLAPLRFGAGLKGKIFDALHTGTPVAMSSIAQEGMFNYSEPFGFVEDNVNQYVTNCVSLYQSEEEWNKVNSKKIEILESNFSYNAFAKALMEKINQLESNSSNKTSNKEIFYTQMLTFHSYGRFKYLSKWISEKSK